MMFNKSPKNKIIIKKIKLKNEKVIDFIYLKEKLNY